MNDQGVAPGPLRPRSRVTSRRPGHHLHRPSLMGLGTATPSLCLEQAAVTRRLAELWQLTGGELKRWHRIVAGAGIERRHGLLPVDEVMGLSTQQRMEVYELNAPALASAAAVRALSQGGLAADRITDLVVVSCTGFSAPGLDVTLVERLGLPPTVRRTIVGFMGCFGAIVGLRNAVATCRADPRAVTLVVCLELCSLHLRFDRSPQNQVASALFADGAAAAVVAGPAACDGASSLGQLTLGHSRLITQGRDWMTWRITDNGFAMTLSREVPGAIRASVAAVVDEAGPSRPGCYIVHPGGPDILEAVDASLGLDGGAGLEAARHVLRGYGNMSSVTVLFVLAEALARGYRPPAMMLAFGPGLAVESLGLA